jgi:hypothetical protein
MSNPGLGRTTDGYQQAKASKAPLFVVGGGVAIGVVGLVVALAMHKSAGSEPATAASQPTPPPAISAPAAPSATAASQQPATSAAVPSTPATVAALPQTPSATTPTPVAARSGGGKTAHGGNTPATAAASAPPAAVTPPAATKPGKKPGCDPNYTLDENGEKHFKPECF